MTDIHEKMKAAGITEAKVIAAVERYRRSTDNPGFCLACGTEAEGVEPDACGYECEVCGEEEVYGAEELLLSC